ncbi:MAG: glutamine synthetase [Enterobacterales bacterium]|jgi:glutamine synthetase
MPKDDKKHLDDFLLAHPDIELFEVFIPDINGHLRGKWLPRSKISNAFDGSLKLPITTLGYDIWGKDVGSWVLDNGDADGILRADVRTLAPVPWLDRPTGQMLLFMNELNGEACNIDPRSILKGLMGRFKKLGLTPVLASEMEFHLFQSGNDQLGRPLHTQTNRSGRDTDCGNTHSIEVMQENSDLMYAVIDACAVQALPIDTLIKEAARSQYEINLYHQPDALLAADQGILLQRTIKGVAKKLGYRASFMAKPYGDIEGNGMHMHCSLIDDEGVNAFNNDTDLGNDLLRQAIAGCLATMKDSMLLFAPHLNSYRRFQPGNHSPTAATWGYENRTVSIRVPAGSHQAMRLEHRVAGADANPHLVACAILAGMLYGIENKLEAPKPLVGDTFNEAEESLPNQWPDAISAFKDSSFIKEYFGEKLQRIFTEAKLQEFNKFSSEVTIQEYDAYL